jgi:hypothetical protein
VNAVDGLPTPSAHAVLDFRRRVVDATLHPITDAVSGNAVDLALAYTRLVAAAWRNGYNATSVAIWMDYNSVWPTPQTERALLRYGFHEPGRPQANLPFFGVDNHPTMDVIQRLQKEAVAILNAGLDRDTTTRYGHNHPTDGTDLDWRLLTTLDGEGQPVTVRCNWDTRDINLLPWSIKLV